jgi:hypothetical protein
MTELIKDAAYTDLKFFKGKIVKINLINDFVFTGLLIEVSGFSVRVNDRIRGVVVIPLHQIRTIAEKEDE